MEITKKMNTYCPRCNKHTEHTVKLYSKGPTSGLKIGNRRAVRKRLGYVGKVKGKASVKKVAQKRKVLLICKECKYTVERVMGSRTKKRLELRAE